MNHIRSRRGVDARIESVPTTCMIVNRFRSRDDQSVHADSIRVTRHFSAYVQEEKGDQTKEPQVGIVLAMCIHVQIGLTTRDRRDEIDDRWQQGGLQDNDG